MNQTLAGRCLVSVLGTVLVLGAVACAPETDGARGVPTTQPTDASNAPPSAPPSAPPDAPPVPRPETRRPNILVIEADDMRTDDLRWMPHVRRFLGDRGLTFANSFAPYPLCCPSRASFLTGRYAHNHQVLSHLAPWGFNAFDDRDTVATRLQAGGYRTALVGKYLNGYGNQPVRGTDQPSLEYVPPGWDDWYAGSDRIWRPGETYDGVPMHGSTYAYFDLTQNIDGRIENFAGRYSTEVMGEQVRSLVTRFGRQPEPWFLWFTPIAPHHGTPRESDDPLPSVRYDGEQTVWKTPARPEWVKGRFDGQIRHAPGTPPIGSAEGDVSDKPRWLRDLPELTEAEKAAATEVARQRAEALFVLDRELGETFRTLRRTGQDDDTVLMFTSDNGYYLGEHRKRQGKIQLHEPSLRVPFLISGPGIPQGRRYDPITTVDLAPTIASIAGIGPLPAADGIDLTDVIVGGDRGWTRPVVTEGVMGAYPRDSSLAGFDSALNTKGLRLGRWKLTEYSTGESELYDLAADPLELRNLAGDPAYLAVARDLRRLWLRYQDCARAACARPLPPRWRTSVEESRSITENELREATTYFRGQATVNQDWY